MESVQTLKPKTKDRQETALASPEAFVTAQPIAELFGVNKRTVALWAENDKIPHYRIGGVIRFKLSEVMEAAARAGASK